MHIGLYFGSFNPIHTGHLIIATHVLNTCPGIDKIWFVLSPHNPLKDSATLLNEYHRLHLAQLAIDDNPKFRASNVEFHLPKPSYTIDTLTYLTEKFPLERFSVILGSDSFQNIQRWKNSDVLQAQYDLVVYNRSGFIVSQDAVPERVSVLDAPLIDISASFIRQGIKAGKSMRYLLPDAVWNDIIANRYYL